MEFPGEGAVKPMDIIHGIPWRRSSKPGISAELSRAGTANTVGPAVDGTRGKLDNSNAFSVPRALNTPINETPQRFCIHPNDLRAGGKPADKADSNSLTSYSPRILITFQEHKTTKVCLLF